MTDPLLLLSLNFFLQSGARNNTHSCKNKVLKHTNKKKNKSNLFNGAFTISKMNGSIDGSLPFRSTYSKQKMFGEAENLSKLNSNLYSSLQRRDAFAGSTAKS